MITLKTAHGQPESGRLVYRENDYGFVTEPRPETCGSSFTINELELMLDDEERQRIVFVEGYCPHVGWRSAVLHPPAAHPGVLVGAKSPLEAGDVVALHPRDERWSVLVDREIGWIRLGRDGPVEHRSGVQFAPGAVAVLEREHLVALWLRPERLPPLDR